MKTNKCVSGESRVKYSPTTTWNVSKSCLVRYLNRNIALKTTPYYAPRSLQMLTGFLLSFPHLGNLFGTTWELVTLKLYDVGMLKYLDPGCRS